MSVTRRQLLQTGTAAGIASLLPARLTANALAHVAQTPLPGSVIPQFQHALPRLSAAGGTIETILAGAEEIVVHMWEPPRAQPGYTARRSATTR